jgi:hypothetical protein
MELQCRYDLLDASSVSTFSHSTEGPRLTFPTAVREAFRFLEEVGYGYESRAETYVVYTKGSIEIRVYHGRSSYEIGLRVGKAGTHQDYPLELLLEAIGSPLAEQYRPYGATSAEEVAKGAEYVASRLRPCIDAGILEQADLFSRLGRMAQQRMSVYALEVRLGHVREAADLAWRAKEYRKVVQLFAPLRDHLSRSELMRLEYSIKNSERP